MLTFILNQRLPGLLKNVQMKILYKIYSFIGSKRQRVTSCHVPVSQILCIANITLLFLGYCERRDQLITRAFSRQSNFLSEKHWEQGRFIDKLIFSHVA